MKIAKNKKMYYHIIPHYHAASHGYSGCHAVLELALAIATSGTHSY